VTRRRTKRGAIPSLKKQNERIRLEWNALIDRFCDIMAVALFALRDHHETSLVIVSQRPMRRPNAWSRYGTPNPISWRCSPATPRRKRRADRTSKAAIPPPQPEEQTMSRFEEYCRLVVDEGADFDDARLAELREQMTREEIQRVSSRLRREAEAAFQEAAALTAWMSMRREGTLT
jgi:hypothetical protein